MDKKRIIEVLLETDLILYKWKKGGVLWNCDFFNDTDDRLFRLKNFTDRESIYAYDLETGVELYQKTPDKPGFKLIAIVNEEGIHEYE